MTALPKDDFRDIDMKPPFQIDGAMVIEWAWSDIPFGEVRNTNGDIVDVIHGLAICKYDGSDVIYRFSCDGSWEVSQDAGYSSVDEAKRLLPSQYMKAPVKWQLYAAQQGDAPEPASPAR